MSLWVVQKKPMSAAGENRHAFYFDGSPGSCDEAMRFSKGFNPIPNSAGNFSGRIKFLDVEVLPANWIVLETRETFGNAEFRREFDFLGRYDFGPGDTSSSKLIELPAEKVLAGIPNA